MLQIYRDLWKHFHSPKPLKYTHATKTNKFLHSHIFLANVLNDTEIHFICKSSTTQMQNIYWQSNTQSCRTNASQTPKTPAKHRIPLTYILRQITNFKCLLHTNSIVMFCGRAACAFCRLWLVLIWCQLSTFRCSRPNIHKLNRRL